MIGEYVAMVAEKWNWKKLVPTDAIIEKWMQHFRVEKLGAKCYGKELSGFLMAVQSIPVEARDIFATFILDTYVTSSAKTSGKFKQSMLRHMPVIQNFNEWQGWAINDDRWYLLSEGWTVLFVMMRQLKMAFEKVLCVLICDF